MSNFDRNAPGRRFGAGVGASAQVDQGLRSYMLGVYNNMVIGLAITGLVALGLFMAAVSNTGEGAVASLGTLRLTEFGMFLFVSPFKWVLMLSPLAVVFFLQFKVASMTASAARTTFFVYAALVGASLSILGLIYAHQSIVQVFFITSASFGTLSLWGYTTKRDLSGMGSFMIMGVFGLLIASLVNIFLHSSGLQWAISLLGVLIFAGLTAYDTQNIKQMYYSGDSYELAEKKSILGALQLYIDFIGLFQFLLAIMGDRR